MPYRLTDFARFEPTYVPIYITFRHSILVVTISICATPMGRPMPTGGVTHLGDLLYRAGSPMESELHYGAIPFIAVRLLSRRILPDRVSS